MDIDDIDDEFNELEGAKQTLQQMANSQWQMIPRVHQREMAQVLLRELARLEAKVAQYEENPSCLMCKFWHIELHNPPCTDCNGPSAANSYYTPWEPDAATYPE